MIGRTPPDVLRLGLGPLADEAEVDRLQVLLKEDPSFRDARIALMTATRAPQSVRVEQVYWFIEHEPHTFLAHHAWMATAGPGMTRSEFYEEAKRRWLLTVDAHPLDIDIVENAAWFMIFFDPHRGADLLDVRAGHQPGLEWAKRAIVYLESAARLHGEEAASFAKRALEAGYRVFRSGYVDERALEFLPSLRKLAEIVGGGDVVEILKDAEAAGQTWHRADGSLRRQLGFTASGLAALAAGDLPHADKHFRNASSIEAFPSDSLIKLATHLLKKGAVEAVLSELEVWKERLLACAAAVTQWADAIQRGEHSPPPRWWPKQRGQ